MKPLVIKLIQDSCSEVNPFEHLQEKLSSFWWNIDITNAVKLFEKDISW